MSYSDKDFTYGAELEFSNVNRGIKVPYYLGAWESSELDIVNTKGKYINQCADPRGIIVPVGGEINTKPSKTIDGQVERFTKIKQLFDDDLDVGITAHTHIHIHIDGFREDLQAMKNFVRYVHKYQKDIKEYCYKFRPEPLPDDNRFIKIKNYLKWDGGRFYPDWWVEQLIEATTAEEFIERLSYGKSGKTIRYQRYFINLHSLKTSNTIEFRCFRGTTKEQEFKKMLEFVRDFTMEALLDNEVPFNLVFNNPDNGLPEMKWDEKQAIGWITTKFKDSRVKSKNRTFWEAD